MTEAEKAKTKFDAGLRNAMALTANDATINGLLQTVHIESGTVYVFGEYGSPGFIITASEPDMKPWKVSFIHLLAMTEGELSNNLIAWAHGEKPTLPSMF